MSQCAYPLRLEQYAAKGTIDGFFDMISVRGRPYFVIHEHGTDVVVRCTFPDDWLPKILGLLGKRVVADGWVQYHKNGKPRRLGSPTSLEPVPEPEKDIQAFRGALPGITGGRSAYEYVRDQREGQESSEEKRAEEGETVMTAIHYCSYLRPESAGANSWTKCGRFVPTEQVYVEDGPELSCDSCLAVLRREAAEQKASRVKRFGF